MTSRAPSLLPLFPNEDAKHPVPTGSPWIIDVSDPATVPVPLQVVINRIEGPYTERDRKLWIFLLHAVFDELETVQVHELAVSEVNRVFRETGGEHDSDWIWESVRRLAKTTAEWEYALGDERFQGTSSIFSAVVSKSSRQSGRIRFNFPPLLVPILKQPSRFARLRVHFLLKLSGKYAVTLYEILEGFVNRQDPTLEIPIADLRTWLKVPESSYVTWKDFRKWVLDPAVAQINSDPLGAGFTADYKANRDGRFYKSVTFTLKKTEHRAGLEKGIRRNINFAKRIDAAQGRPVLRPETYDKARTAAPRLDVHGAEHEFWAYWESTGKQPFKRTADAAFIGFCRKKAETLELL